MQESTYTIKSPYYPTLEEAIAWSPELTPSDIAELREMARKRREKLAARERTAKKPTQARRSLPRA